MHKILSTILNDETMKDIAANFARHKEFLIYGLSGTQKAVTIAAAFAKNPRPTIIIVSEREKISAWQDDLTALLPKTEIEELPELDLFSVKGTVGIERKARRLELLMKIASGQPVIILATATSAVKKDFSRQDFSQSQIKLELGKNFSQEILIKKLVEFGYERTDEIDAIGKFSVRGGILDIFAINAPKPYRIEFFGDTVDSMREINFETLRSEKNIDAANILPIFSSDNKKAEPFTTCAGTNGTIIFDEPARIKDTLDALAKEDAEIKNNATSLIGSADRIVKDFEGKIDEADKTKLEEQKAGLQKAIDENKSTDELKKLSDELQQTMFSISQKAYEAVQKEDQSTASSESASSTEDKKDDDVIDAEYTKE